MAIKNLVLNDTTKLQELQGGQAKQVYQFTYDFAVNGGAQGTINLTQINGVLPTNFIVQNALLDIITAVGSAGAAVAAVTTGQAANDLVVATVVAGAAT